MATQPQQPFQPTERFADPAQESLSQALRAGFNVLRVIMVVLIVAYFLSGRFRVDPGEQGLVVRFGQLRTADTGKKVFEPGWYVALPDPFDEKIRVSGQVFRVPIDTFCFRLPPDSAGKELTALVPQLERIAPQEHGTLLCGDRGLTFGRFTVEYRIIDAERFVTHIGDSPSRPTADAPPAAQVLIARLAEAAICRTVAGLPIHRVTRLPGLESVDAAGAVDFAEQIRDRLQAELNSLDAGIEVVRLNVQTVFPSTVQQAFLAVTIAASQAEKARSEALTEKNQILLKTAGAPGKHEPLLEAIDRYGAAQAVDAPESRLAELRAEIDGYLDVADGEVSIALKDAETKGAEAREQLKREYEEFASVRAAYLKNPRLTTLGLWRQMLEEVLTSSGNELFFVPSVGDLQIQTNRDPLKLLEADEQRYRDKFKARP